MVQYSVAHVAIFFLLVIILMGIGLYIVKMQKSVKAQGKYESGAKGFEEKLAMMNESEADKAKDWMNGT